MLSTLLSRRLRGLVERPFPPAYDRENPIPLDTHNTDFVNINRNEFKKERERKKKGFLKENENKKQRAGYY